MLILTKNIASFIAAFGGLGVGIDFFLSPEQKERIKDWILKKWVDFEDMRLSEFSEREAAYFVVLSDRIFGSRLFSWRRVLSCIGIYIVCLIFWLANVYLTIRRIVVADLDGLFILSELSVTVLFLALSISLTRFISLMVIKIAAGLKLALLPYLTLIGVHLWLFVHWRVVSDTLISNTGIAIRFGFDQPFWQLFVSSLRDAIDSLGITPKHWYVLTPGPVWRYSDATGATRWTLSFVASSFRLLVAFGIFGTFIFRKWIASLVSLVWRRAIEDKAPAFTLIFGGIGAIAGMVKGTMELFSKG